MSETDKVTLQTAAESAESIMEFGLVLTFIVNLVLNGVMS